MTTSETWKQSVDPDNVLPGLEPVFRKIAEEAEASGYERGMREAATIAARLGYEPMIGELVSALLAKKDFQSAPGNSPVQIGTTSPTS